MTAQNHASPPRSFRQRQLAGPGGMSQVLGIAFPMIVSHACDTLMLFIDRLFLSRLGAEQLAAGMSGGMTSFVFCTFFLGLIGYSNALVAQNLGAGHPERCGLASAQGLILACICAPLVIAAIPLGTWLFAASGHSESLRAHEVPYFTILCLGSLFPLLRAGLGSFFSGTGRTGPIMTAAALALVVNVCANYVLIFGKLGFPALGVAGAAYGTILGGAASVAWLIAVYFCGYNRRRYHTAKGFRYDPKMMRTLLRFGFPSGVEFFMTLFAFNVFMLAFQGCGTVEAASITIVFNWSLLAFLPMLGLQVGAASLVGRYMGAKHPDHAARAAHSALKLGLGYSALWLVPFVLFPDSLVAVFATREAIADHAAIETLAAVMLQLAAGYTVSDAAFVVFGGALRGAGDTRWTMYVSVALHWISTASCLALMRLQAAPTTVWSVFVVLAAVMGVTLWLRFRSGHWRTIRVLDP